MLAVADTVFSIWVSYYRDLRGFKNLAGLQLIRTENTVSVMQNNMLEVFK